jgi:hypothetical protein
LISPRWGSDLDVRGIESLNPGAFAGLDDANASEWFNLNGTLPRWDVPENSAGLLGCPFPRHQFVDALLRPVVDKAYTACACHHPLAWTSARTSRPVPGRQDINRYDPVLVHPKPSAFFLIAVPPGNTDTLCLAVPPVSTFSIAHSPAGARPCNNQIGGLRHPPLYLDRRHQLRVGSGESRRPNHIIEIRPADLLHR